jgi:hypothetical protein
MPRTYLCPLSVPLKVDEWRAKTGSRTLQRGRKTFLLFRLCLSVFWLRSWGFSIIDPRALRFLSTCGLTQHEILQNELAFACGEWGAAGVASDLRIVSRPDPASDPLV